MRTALSTLTVLNNHDSGPGSLRDAIAAAASGDQIVFDPTLSGQTITLTTGELFLNQNLTITGPGANQLTISGNNSSRVFEMDSSTTDSISGLTISHGRTVHWAGGILNDGTLTLSNATVSDNLTVGDDVDYGGGIYNNGTLTVQHSAITRNTARYAIVGAESGWGGGIYNVPTVVRCRRCCPTTISSSRPTRAARSSP